MNIILINIKVIANAKKNSIVAQTENTQGKMLYKIKIAAPALEGKANRAIIEYISKLINESKSHIVITHGLKSSMKTIAIKTKQTDKDIRKRIEKFCRDNSQASACVT